jgi:phenylpropionate dioxygenase-like ring-hydroxylating dioxygenase large terminal subunit
MSTSTDVVLDAKPQRMARPAIEANRILLSDPVPPPQTLLEPSEYVPPIIGIETKRYVSQEFHDLEMARLWPRVWQFACWGYDIPNAGDISVYRCAGQSVLIVRQKDRSVKAFRNSCLHRGMELCTQPTHQKELRCPYHAFTWALDGSLTWVPARWDFPQIEDAKTRLPEIRVHEWNGFVFINFDPAAPSFESYFGRMLTQWSDSGWDFHNRYRVVTVEKQLNCNWKVALDAFIETLHVYATHPQAAALIPDTCTQYDVYADEPHFSRFHTLTGHPSENIFPEPSPQEVLDCYTETYYPEAFGTAEGDLATGENVRQALHRLASKTYQDRLGIDISKLPDSETLDGTEYFMFPNTLIWPSLANPLGYRFRPGATPDTSVWETMIFLPFAGERPPSGPIIKVGVDESMAEIKELGIFAPLLQQDTENLARMQSGLKSSASGSLTLSRYQEARIRHYHETLGHYVAKSP